MWLEIKEEDKKDFLQIIRVLNRFYNESIPKVKWSESMVFRNQLVLLEESEFRVFLKKIGEYEFLVSVFTKSGVLTKNESWLHIDGIKQERDNFIKTGVNNHPAFTVVCLTDLYEKGIVTDNLVIEELLNENKT